MRRLVYFRWVGDNNIWRLEIGKPASARSFISSTRGDSGPRYSPDGKRIAFTSSRSGANELYICDSDGLNAVRVTPPGIAMAPVGSPRWSPDGTRIAFDARGEGQCEIYVIDSNGANLKRLTDNPANNVVPSWSGDGKWIYFGSDRSGRLQIWKMPAEGGEPVQVTKDGGAIAVESRDGRSLYYAKERVNTSLWRVPVGGGPEEKVLEEVWYLEFDITEDGIYFVPRHEAASSEGAIHFYDFETRSAKPIAKIGKPAGTHVSVSPDEQFLLYTQTDLADADLMLVENFR